MPSGASGGQRARRHFFLWWLSVVVPARSRKVTVSAPMLCMAKYDRSKVMGSTLYCQHPKGHLTPCSWQELADADRASKVPLGSAALRIAQGDVVADDNVVQHVAVLCENITRGYYDVYLELLLATCHNRKRARRGTLGF